MMLALILAGLALAPARAAAGSARTTLGVSATVVRGCEVSADPNDGTSVRCGRGAVGKVSVGGPGNGPAPTAVSETRLDATGGARLDLHLSASGGRMEVGPAPSPGTVLLTIDF